MTPIRNMVRDFAYRYVGGSALVLVYHRVADLESDPELIAVRPERFDDQMRMLREKYRVLRLGKLAASLKRKWVPDRAICVTFDDGYSDSLSAARPILEANGIPATVFVSSGYVEADREFWWDELGCMLLAAGTLPRSIEIVVGASRFEEHLDDSLDYSGADAERDRGWNTLMPPQNSRQRLYVRLGDFIRPLSASHREEVLRQLREIAGIEDAVRPTHRPLSRAEVAELDSSGLVEVGGHTVNHPVLSQLDVPEQRREIVSDMEALADMCGRRITSFSYPFGRLEDYTSETVEIVRQEGFECACSNHPGVVKLWSDPYRIPRHLVRDWTAEELAERLEEWLRDEW